jgi:UDP-N-acetylmuramoyl-L-alanyl-D-glutamate--2,6-diaminopimelate ligase
MMYKRPRMRAWPCWEVIMANKPSISLSELVQGFFYLGKTPPSIEVTGLSMDSRALQKGDLFFACAGEHVHGKVFMGDAIANGACAVLWESSIPKREERQGVPVYGVPDLKQVIGPMAERFYGYPSRDLLVIGITGTNGKTSSAHYIAQALNQDARCGMVGTLGNGLFGKTEPGIYTTPDAVTLHQLFATMRDEGATRVVMEASSHGLDQGRVAGVSFDVAVLTNLTHEHLDYHGSLENYGRAKRRLFETKGLKYAVINIDDNFGRELLVSMPGSVGTVSYGFKDEGLTPSLLGSNLQLDKAGLCMHVESDWGKGDLRVPLLGRFNAENLLAALGVLLACGIGFDTALQRLSEIEAVPGRMSGFGGAAGQPLVVVDYAHTPHALEQALTELRVHTSGQLWCLFGCGGDRDRAKRPMMGKIAQQLADHVVVTQDNPRSEDPALIVADIFGGFEDADAVAVINDRAQAIAQVIAEAKPDDVVLVAGKGHERFQIINEARLPFSDADEVQKALAIRGRQA